jgi:CRISPR-associated protein (TIGR03984 family)
MRLFGVKGEIMIWRSDQGFQGRLLLDQPNLTDSPTRPDNETRILAGDRLIEGSKEGFSRVATAAGTQQAVPLECTDQDFKGGRWPLRLNVRHYFEGDEESGTVRVAASRLVHVFKEVR